MFKVTENLPPPYRSHVLPLLPSALLLSQCPHTSSPFQQIASGLYITFRVALLRTTQTMVLSPTFHLFRGQVRHAPAVMVGCKRTRQVVNCAHPSADANTSRAADIRCACTLSLTTPPTPTLDVGSIVEFVVRTSYTKYTFNPWENDQWGHRFLFLIVGSRTPSFSIAESRSARCLIE